jgi:HlyD family secretion protein
MPDAPSPKPTLKKPNSRGRTAMRWARRVAWIAAAMVVVAMVVVAWLPKPVAVDVAKVTRGPMRVTVDEAGRTRVKDRFVVSAPLGGNVMRIELRPGDRVKAGDVVARIVPAASPLLDTRTRAEAEARVAVALAGQKQAEAAVNRATLAYERSMHEQEDAKRLAQTGAISQDSRERAELEARVRAEDVASAKFAVQMSNHEVVMAQTALRRVTGKDGGESFDVPAPADGVIIRVTQPSGGVMPPGTPLVELGDPKALEIVCDVLTADAVRLHSGAKVDLDRWGGDPLHGHVRLVEPGAFTRISALGVEEQRVAVVVDLDDPAEKWTSLGDGFRLDAHLVVWEEPSVLVVPSSAVFRHEGAWVAYVIANERAELRPVEVGQRNGPEVQVLKGLSEGEQVLVHPSDQVRAGVRVAPR